MQNPGMTYSGPKSDPRWIALQAILASRQFAKSARLSSFLLYIGIAELENRQDEVTEQQIGLHVFKRPADFNSAEDNIVRTTARQLRQRLALYYQEDGNADEIRVDVPRGGYLPVFQTRSVVTVEPSPVPSSPEANSPALAPVGGEEEEIKSLPSARWPFLLAGVAFLLGIGCTLLVRYWGSHQESRPSVSHALWSVLFTAGQPTVFVPGDAGLTMYDNLARTQVGVNDYMTGAYLREPAAQTPAGYRWTPLAGRRYVSIVDLRFADHLRALPEFRSERYQIVYARDLHVTDFRNSNLILAGGPIHNPWIEVFDKGLNFHFVYDGPTNVVRVINRSPQKGESAVYTWSPDAPNRGYAYIALVDNLQHDGKVLLVEGTTMGAVDAGESFLLNDPRIGEILQKSHTSGQRLNNFELLLESAVIDGISLHTNILATRFHSAS
jgi:hypothetical protein